MKRVISAALVALSMFAASAQVMSSNGVINTVWSGFGTPDSANTGVHWYGITDTLQARVDVSQFTMEGMINLALFEDFDGNNSHYFRFSEKTAFYAANKQSDAVSSVIDNAITDAYYVNFLWHPVKGLDFGAGTRLEWKIGPAPACSDYYWGPKAHVKEGGLKYAAPDGYIGYYHNVVPGATDVAGYTYYPNVVTSTIKGYTIPGSFGIRYTYDPYVQVAMAVPSGTCMDDFSFNAGIRVTPVNWLSMSFAYEGIARDEGHLYAGATFGINKDLTLNGYFAMNNVGGDKNVENGITGFGLSGVLNFSKISLTLTPEFGMTFYENTDYTAATYVGTGLDIAFAKQFEFGTWFSCAWGSANTNWKNDEAFQSWDGGFVLDVRPTITMNITKNHALSAYCDFQERVSYKHDETKAWAAGIYWQFKN